MTTFPLIRALNFLFVRVDRPGDRPLTLFLDTGMPWTLVFTRDLPAEASPLCGAHPPVTPKPAVLEDLERFSGFELDGLVGAGTLSRFAALDLDWDRGTLQLHDEPPPPRAGRALRMDAGFHVEVDLDGLGTRPLLDLGARFNVIDRREPPAGRPAHRMTHPSAVGHVDVAVVPDVQLTCVDLDGVRREERGELTYGPPTPPCHILGMAWLTRRNVRLEPGAGRLTFTDRVTPRARWETLSAELRHPRVLHQLDPGAWAAPDRGFRVLPSGGHPLPRGLAPGVEYRVKGLELPAGHEGVNALHDALHAPGDGPVVLVGPGGDVELERGPCFE